MDRDWAAACGVFRKKREKEKGQNTGGCLYCGNGNAMLEVYSPGDMHSPDYECGIWVLICKSEENEAAEIVSSMMITGIL